MIMSQVEGQFQEFEGDFLFDPQELLIKDLSIKISAASLNTNNKMRDNHLRRNDFFHVDQHPVIYFKTKSGTAAGLKLAGKMKRPVAQVTGDLTLRGITKQVVLELVFLGQRKDTWGKMNAFFKFQSSINRKDFHINWNKTLDNQELLVGDTILIDGHIQAQMSGEKTASSRFLIPDTKQARTKERLNRGEKVPLPPVVNEVNELKELKANTNQVVIKAKSSSLGAPPGEGKDIWKTISGIIVVFFGLMGTFLSSYSLRMFLVSEDEARNKWVDYGTGILVIIFSYSFAHAFYIMIS